VVALFHDAFPINVHDSAHVPDLVEVMTGVALLDQDDVAVRLVVSGLTRLVVFGDEAIDEVFDGGEGGVRGL